MSVNNRVSVPAFAEAVNEASNGALVIEHYPGGTLGSGPVQQLSMVENGVVDIAEVVTAYSPGRFPELSIFELPFLAENNVEAGLAAYAMYEDGLLSDFDDLMLAGIIISGPYGISTKQPIASLADLEGLRLRAAGPIQTAMVQALGAVPVGNVPAPQIAENISRGLIDGALMAPGNLFNFRITDAATHHLFDLDLGSVAVIFPIRRSTYDAMSADAQAAFDQYAGEWLTRTLGENLDLQEAETIAAIAGDGTQTIHSWSDEDIATARERLAGVAAEWDRDVNGVNLFDEVNEALAAARTAN
jgi:TRAP-type C4-dicarboxylate transport system substrate-binding protein